MQVTRTPADVLATLSRRYREHYGDRLVGIYAVPEFPFSDDTPEKTEDDDVRAIEVLVILHGPYDPFEETDPVVDIAMDVTEECDWKMGILVRHAAHNSDFARRIEGDGVDS
ncbi:MAG: hypothetical protein V5A20_08985 [Salinibacter sp.]|jgi:hypothetical protein|uniref:hypothetical protein n=1 Tax=Salinibacter sp. TaxID=2065818 RepID=UPI002FC32376